MQDPTDYHIAFFSNNYLPFVGGVTRSIQLYHAQLKKLGAMVRIYAPEYEGAHEDSEEVRRIISLTGFNHSDFSIPMPLSFKPLVDFRNEDFDLVHVHHPFFLGEMGMRMARSERLPLIFTYHTRYEQYTHYAPISEDTAVRTITKHANDFCELCDLVIAPTKDMEQHLRERGVTTDIEVLPTGVDMEAYRHADAQAARKKLGIAPEAPMLLHVGRLAKEKNENYLFSAVLEVLREVKDAVFVVAGDGEKRAELEAMCAKDATCKARVRFLGTVEAAALIPLYAAADLFLFSSVSETQGMVLVEAMAGGTPVIALDADAIRDVVEDDVNGRLLHAGTSDREYARAVMEALANPDRRRQWSEGALKTADGFDMTRLAARMLECYRHVKLLPHHRLKQGTMSFGLVGSYLGTVWEKLLLR
jgi:1,2-diacylglycerol 3-alpha-glucosyltransferase